MKPKKDEQKKPAVRVCSMSDNQCVWMKAGVVNYKICENAFDCTTCAFDKMISGKAVRKPTALGELERRHEAAGVAWAVPAHADGSGPVQVMLTQL